MSWENTTPLAKMSFTHIRSKSILYPNLNYHNSKIFNNINVNLSNEKQAITDWTSVAFS